MTILWTEPKTQARSVGEKRDRPSNDESLPIFWLIRLLKMVNLVDAGLLNIAVTKREERKQHGGRPSNTSTRNMFPKPKAPTALSIIIDYGHSKR
jgi:hypothetical protein